MDAKVSLTAVVSGLEEVDQHTRVYLNRRTGETVALLLDELSAVEDGVTEFGTEWEAEAAEMAAAVLDSADYVPLPTSFDIHEYRIMESFCYSYENEQISDHLLDAIRGRGAFRRFKDMIHRFDIADEWYAFRYRELARIAVDWLEDENIPFKPDLDDDKEVDGLPSPLPTAPLDEVDLSDLAWLAGDWRGQRGADEVEEQWSQPNAGAMMGMFRWMHAGAIRFYELIVIEREAARLVMRIKHFNPGLFGWEEKDQSVEFDLVYSGDTQAAFLQRGTPLPVWLVYERQKTKLSVYFLRADQPRDPASDFRYALFVA